MQAHTVMTTPNPSGIGIGERMRVESPTARTKTARMRAKGGFSALQDLRLRIFVSVRRSGSPALDRRGSLPTHHYPSTPKASQSVLGS